MQNSIAISRYAIQSLLRFYYSILCTIEIFIFREKTCKNGKAIIYTLIKNNTSQFFSLLNLFQTFRLIDD